MRGEEEEGKKKNEQPRANAYELRGASRDNARATRNSQGTQHMQDNTWSRLHPRGGSGEHPEAPGVQTSRTMRR